MGVSIASRGILSWNVCSVRKRESELRHLLNLFIPAIVLLQETHLYPGVASPSFQGYNFLRLDRANSQRGGVALLIKDDIPYTAIEIKNTKFTEIIAIKIPCNNNEIVVASIYIPPSKGRFKELKGIFSQLGQYYILAGDLNSHNTIWGAPKTNEMGRYLERLLPLFDARLHIPPDVTRIHPTDHRKDAILDYCISHSTLESINIQVLPDGSSDHRPILLTLPDHCTIYNCNNTRLVTDWEGIAGDLSRITWPDGVDTCAEDIDTSVRLIQSHIQVAMLNNTKSIFMKNSYNRLIPLQIHNLIKRKRKLQHRFKKARNASLKNQIKQISKLIRKELKQWELETKIKKIKEIDETEKRWKILGQWKTKTPKIPTIRANGLVYFSAQHKANIFAQTLSTKFTEHSTDSRFSIQNEIDKFVIPSLDSNVPLLTPAQVSEAIDEGKVSKSPGYDGICYRILRSLNVGAITFLTKLYNAMTKTQYFPDALKSGIVVVIPKPGKPPDNPNSYRPITLLPTLGKVYERCILGVLQRVERRLKIIPDEQHGFRSSHSCGTQLARVSETLARAFNRGKFTIMTALDVEAAFDKVPFKHLLFKMSRLNFPDWSIRLLASYFENRSCRVKIDDALSAPFTLQAGTPQGGLLSPFLYSIYTSDVPLNLTSTTIALYADDTLLITTADRLVLAEIDANLALQELESYFLKWKIKVNGLKSQSIVLSPNQINFTPNLFIFNSKITISNSLTYLGVIFDNKLLYNEQVKATVLKAKQRTAALLAHIRDLPASTKTKTLLYTTFIRPILTYGAAAWGAISKTTFEQLLRVERRWIRTILGIPRWAKRSTYLEAAPFPLLDTVVTKELQRLLDMTYTHDNPTVRSLGSYQRSDGRRRRYPLERVTPVR